MTARSSQSAQDAKRELVRTLTGEVGFVGAGISTAASGQTQITVHVESKNSPVVAKVPAVWRGFDVQIQAVGKARKH